MIEGELRASVSNKKEELQGTFIERLVRKRGELVAGNFDRWLARSDAVNVNGGKLRSTPG